MPQYTNADRAQWRDEIAEAKRSKSREDFIAWLRFRLNVAGNR